MKNGHALHDKSEHAARMRHESSGSDAAFHAQVAAAAVAAGRGGASSTGAVVVVVLGAVFAAVLAQVNRFAPEPYMVSE